MVVSIFVRVISIGCFHLKRVDCLGWIGMTTPNSNHKGCVDGLQFFDSLLDWILVGLDIEPEVLQTEKVCIFGVGQCSMAGELISDFADNCLGFPVAMISDTRVPGWVGEGTLSIVLSTTGESIEMMDVLDSLRSSGSDIVCVTADGPVASRCATAEERIPIPSDAIGFGRAGFCIGAVASLISSATGCDLRNPICDVVNKVKSFADGLSEDYINSLAERIGGHVNAFYSTSDIHACSKWWKQVFDSNRSSLSFFGELPEFDHNELVGWSDSNSHAKELSMVVLKGSGESKLVDDIVSCMIEVLNENGRDVVTIDLGGDIPLESNLRGVVLGCALSKCIRGV